MQRKLCEAGYGVGPPDLVESPPEGDAFCLFFFFLKNRLRALLAFAEFLEMEPGRALKALPSSRI